MKTIKVNMNPNPLDVQTIHASQNDTEARQWGFELHNNGELIDTSDVKEQLFFKAYKGGTEQILPENTSTPTTSPFKGDIKYPQGLLSDQEFLYRESPTEEDGLAKITDIKGNTLVWNQLVQKGNMTDGWTFSNSSGVYSNNVLTFIAEAQDGFVRPNNPQNIVANHKYLAMVDVKGTSAFTSAINFTSRNLLSASITTNWQTFSLVFTNTTTEQNYFPRIYDNRASGWDSVQVKNCMLFDLTQMGLDITSPSDFTSLFPLPYYAYNQGTLLSFNGNGIKTAGFNQWDEEWEVGSYSSTGKKVPTSGGRIRSINKIPVLPSTTYYMAKGVYILCQYDANKSFISFTQLGIDTPSNIPHTVSIGANTHYIAFATYAQYGATYNHDICINISDTSKNGTYEPYTSSTLSLPISTYFPSGMKSAGSVYDELTETKAINRLIKTVVDGTNKTANYYGTFQGHQLFYIDLFATTYVSYANMANLLSNLYETATNVTMDDKHIRYQASDKQVNIGRIYWNDDSYTSASAMNTALQSSPLEIVSLAQSETVETFSVASLVTENTEIPLSNEDGVLVGKCNSDVSADAGFIEGKIKLSDSDGDVYSNKIQIHVERMPE